MNDKKLVSLDIFEMGYLLDACIRGSHLRSDTIRRFVDEWYDLFTENERMRLFEWTIRLTYDQRWTSNGKDYKPHFEPCTTCCGHDVEFVHRYHPKHADLTFDIMARELREVVVPFVDSHYNTIKNAHGRAISGLSMGGRHTMFSGMERCLDLFANFGVLSAGDAEPEKTMPKFMNTSNVNDKIDYLFVGQGTEEQSGFFNVRVKGFTDALNARGIKHEYYAGGHGGHDWSTWRHLLYYCFLPNLFQNVK